MAQDIDKITGAPKARLDDGTVAKNLLHDGMELYFDKSYARLSYESLIVSFFFLCPLGTPIESLYYLFARCGIHLSF